MNEAARTLKQGLHRLNSGDHTLWQTVLRLDPKAALFESEDSLSFKTMRSFRPRNTAKVNSLASGRLWAHAWCRDHAELDALMEETTADSLMYACASVYDDLYDFAGVPWLRELLDTFMTPSVLLRALDVVQQRPGMDLSPLKRLELPVARVRALNLLDETLELPETVMAVEASLEAGGRRNDDVLRRWAEAARMFSAAGLTADECTDLLPRVGWRSFRAVYENRVLPQEYWDTIT